MLEEKQKFVYIFDFGDEWQFSCRVLRITDEPCGSFEIIRTVGESPEQYSYYDEY
ncbi:MAG: plasmid pRiA4b ORF-3 family protein [Oscillospiraceae bacterium]|nr:plasmid pRiA4b ORF-3 family protein [Oscillospiraceae bacterium]